MSMYLKFPKQLTQEEELLKSKYAILRQLKQKAMQRNNLNTSKPENKAPQEKLKQKASKIIAAKGGIKSEANLTTASFKKPSSRKREFQAGLNRSAKREYFPDSEGQTRSVAVRGAQLTEQFLKKTFEKIGTIWKIRHSDDCAIVTFKTPECATLAVETLNGIVIDGKNPLSVQYTRRKNQTWKEILVEDRKIATDNHLLQKKRTVYVSCNASMSIKELRYFFRNIGVIENIYMTKESRSQKRSYAFVTFTMEEDAQKAVQELDGSFWKEGIRIKICPQKIHRNDDLGAASIPILDNSARDIIEYPE